MTAYDVKAYQIVGRAWLDTDRYDIAAKVPQGATKEQVNGMWQNLLAERFGVMLHHESKEFPVEELVVGKSGSKLKESADDPAAAMLPGPPQLKNGELLSPGLVTTIVPGPNGAKGHTVAKAQPLSKLTTMMGNQLNRPVLDKTGLTGIYDFTLDYSFDLAGLPLPPPPPGPAAVPGETYREPGPTLAAAVQQQLGLRLVASKSSTKPKKCPLRIDLEPHAEFAEQGTRQPGSVARSIVAAS